MPRTECLTPQELAAFSLGELPDPLLDGIAEHLEHCPQCDAASRQLDGLSDGVIAALRCPPLADVTLRSPSHSHTRSSMPVPEPALPPVVPGYEIVEELGRGGMGVVYKARHAQLHRIVALKMLLAGDLADRAALQRFRIEAEAVARLQHPNIVQLFEVGELADGSGASRPYFTLELVDGGTLATRLAGKPQPALQAAQWLESLARATHYAHCRGIIHRDLKPSNILLTQDGQPKICDFGVSKLIEGGTGKTLTGTVLGTPEYMAPEQAGGTASASPATDTYALGAILYTVLTGRAPLQGATPLDTLRQVQRAEPVPPGRLQPNLPRDLETICLKCLEKEPQRRYATAEALADDLHRFLDGRPIQARRVGTWARAWKWSKRRPAPAGLLALAFFILTVGFPGMTLLWFRADSAREAEVLQRDRAEAARDQLESAVYAGRITLADHAYKANDVAVVRELLAKCEPQPGRPDLRGWEWYYLARLCHSDLLPGLDHGMLADAWVNAVAIRGDGRRIASGAGLPFFGSMSGYAPGAYAAIPGEVKVWDAATGKCLATLHGHRGSAHAVAFSPDGKWLASGGLDGSVCLWDGETFEVRPGLPVTAGTVRCLAFSPDGRRLAVAAAEATLLWDLDSNHLTRFPGAACLVFSPDGQRLLTVGGADVVKTWDVHTGTAITHEILTAFSDFRPHMGWCAAQSRDGKYLALAQDSTIQVWETAGKKRHHVLSGHTNTVLALAFCPDGRLASGSDDRTVRLWNVETEKEVRVYRGHRSGITSLAVGADGKRLVSGSKDLSVKVWDLTRDNRGSSFRVTGHGEYLINLTFTPDSRRLLVVNPNPQNLEQHLIRALDVTAENLHDLFATGFQSSWPNPYQFFVWSGDGGRLAATDLADAKTVIIRDSASGAEVNRFQTPQGESKPVALSYDGQRIAFSGHTIKPPDGERVIVSDLCVADVSHGEKVQHLPIPLWVISSGAFSRDGRLLAVAANTLLEKEGKTVRARTTEIHVWDTKTGQEVLIVKGAHDLPARGLAFSPDGSKLATAGYDGKVRLWNLATGQDIFPPLQTSAELSSVAFSPDGRRLAATGMDSLVRLWDANTGHDLLILKGFGLPGTGHYGFMARVVFSPDGRFLAANEWDGTVTIWDAGELRPESVAKGRSGDR